VQLKCDDLLLNNVNKCSYVLNNEERTKCEIWVRVMGYHRPISSWNKGKQAEHKERLYFKESCCST